MSNSKVKRRHVVVIGGGFGGLATAKKLRKADVDVTLVDRHNYHLFQPLLYQVATGGLSPANIATPLRFLLRRHVNCQVLLAEVTDIDVSNQRVILADGQLSYDELVIATGSTHSYFGRDEWQANAPGLKSLADATNIRRRIFLAFEAAERETDPETRTALMTFVIVGAGPTGVELAGALSEIAKHTLRNDFRHISPGDARIIIVEAGQRVLSHYPVQLCDKAAAKIQALDIEVLTQTKVTDIAVDQVSVSGPDGDSVIATHTVLWAAGVQANPLGRIIAQQCGVECDPTGRVPVSPNLNVGQHDNVHVIGDLAWCLDDDGAPLPGLAPVAIQQGTYVAKSIIGRMKDRPVAEPFKYADPGTMATIGRAAAVAQIGKRQFSGFFAWILWLVVHLMQIAPRHNRMLILMQWAWNYLTFNRSSRIITGEDELVIVNPPARVTDRSPSSPETSSPDAPSPNAPSLETSSSEAPHPTGSEPTRSHAETEAD